MSNEHCEVITGPRELENALYESIIKRVQLLSSTTQDRVVKCRYTKQITATVTTKYWMQTVVISMNKVCSTQRKITVTQLDLYQAALWSKVYVCAVYIKEIESFRQRTTLNFEVK